MIDNFCLCNSSSCNCSWPLGIEESSNASKALTISPNPVSSEFQISNFKFQTGDEIIFADALGKILFTKKIESPTSNVKLQTSNFSNGIYFLELKTKEGDMNKKVVVQH
jgi:pectate lyase